MRTTIRLMLTALLLATSLLATEAQAEEPLARTLPKMDHAPLLGGPFADTKAVTKTCLMCHSTDGKEVRAGNHGMGAAADDAVDCLTCHADPLLWKWGLTGEELKAAAQSVGKPHQGNCGTCHFRSGPDADMTADLLRPTADIDVHMGRAGFACTNCHFTTEHNIAAGAQCTMCHGPEPHGDMDLLDDHADSVDCRACHIPQATTHGWRQPGADCPDPTAADTRLQATAGATGGARSHMIHPGEQALGCLDCHGDTGEIDFEALGYSKDAWELGRPEGGSHRTALEAPDCEE